MFSNPLPTQNPLGNRPTDRSLAKLMTSYWIAFIHDLDPNGSDCESPLLVRSKGREAPQQDHFEPELTPLRAHRADPDAPVWPEYGASKSNMVFERQASYGEHCHGTQTYQRRANDVCCPLQSRRTRGVRRGSRSSMDWARNWLTSTC